MAVIKCKMCGGDLQIVEGNSVCECEYCGSKQTVPTADNEKKMTLFTRANRLLRSCEFDKASGVFETIVAEFPEEAEAYWGLVLCKYGIEYVDDPATGKKIPTCHRSSFESVQDDSNFEQACENSDAVARRVYRDEARQIEALRQAILQVSGKEEPYDIFISYKETDEKGDRTLDSVIAQEIYKELTNDGYRVFFSRISLEDKLGTEYEPYIFAALNSAKVMLVVGTDYENFDAVWVKNEWSRFLKLIASGQKKTLIPVFKNMDAYDMPKEFAKLSAQNMDKVGAMQDLIRGVEKLVTAKKYINQPQNVIIQQDDSSVKIDSAIKRGNLALEDGEWNKARQFFDQALSLDAECAEAYFGIALADFQARDMESFIHDVTNQTPKIQYRSIPEEHEHINKAVSEYTVINYLSESDIRTLYKYDLHFPSEVKGQQEIQSKVQQQIEENRNLSKALRFSNGKETVQIEAFKKTIYQILQDNVDNANKEEYENIERIRREYATFIKDADLFVQERYSRAIKDQQTDYDQACAEQRSAETIEDYQFTIKHFEKTIGFKDTNEHINECKLAIEDIKAKNAIYDSARSQMTGWKTESYEEAIKAFRKILDWKDSKDQIESCQRRIEEINKKKESERHEAEKQRALKERTKKRRKTITIVGFVIIIIGVVAWYVLSPIITERIEYNKNDNAYVKAKQLLADGQYDAAISAFREIESFKDSSSLLVEAQSASKYEEAEKMLKNKDYGSAIEQFEKLGNYKDSRDKAEKIRVELYDAAVSAVKKGQYIKAYDDFTVLGDFKDSLQQINKLMPEYKKALLSAGEIGSYVIFGAYEQDNDLKNGKEELEWKVLAKNGTRILVICKYAINNLPRSISGYGNTWEECSIREWLNDTFLNEAFSTEDQAMIPTVTVSSEASEYDSKQGNDTQDKVFLLSLSEAREYFSSNEERRCAPTEYAKVQVFSSWTEGIWTDKNELVDGKNACDWDLRTLGYDSSFAQYVSSHGEISTNGHNGHFAPRPIRPAIWINVGS